MISASRCSHCPTTKSGLLASAMRLTISSGRGAGAEALQAFTMRSQGRAGVVNAKSGSLMGRLKCTGRPSGSRQRHSASLMRRLLPQRSVSF